MLENLDRLKVFYHVVTQGSVVAAAEALHVSQSAVSQAIRKLEREVGSPLFIRLHKQLIPTAAGDGLYQIVQPFILNVGSYLKDLELGKDHPAGELRLGAPQEFGKAYLPPTVAGFREQHQAVTFTLQFGTPETLLPLLRKGQLDFAFVDVFLTKSTHVGSLDMYHLEPIVEEEVILACSKHYYEQFLQADLSYTSLSQQNFISYSKDLQTGRQWFKHHFSKANIRLREVLTVDSHEAVISAIKHHVGMGVVASHLITPELRSGQIVQIKSSRSEIINSIALVHLQDKIPTFTEKIFVRYLVDTIKEMIAQDHLGNEGFAPVITLTP
ncbi:LysR family transcriptional regulator [Desulfogranum mediterraneum]|uniref:LysR family transcriptional regulator n=1 Tax=Desulfogranum mediterraneum TaxID=160661 RepID=UPI00040BA743|nr:LysR family transcriptional regulator [Desulfogranum mediterraneum]